jgi:hypothetical protein
VSPPSGLLAEVLELAVSRSPEDAERLQSVLGGAHDELIDGLFDRLGNWFWGHAASKALVKLGPRVLPAVQRRAEGQDHVPGSALWVLGQIQDPRSVELALQALEKGAPSVQEAAAEALGELGDRQAIPALRVCLAGSDRPARCSAAWALGRLGDRESLPAILELTRETAADPEEDFEYLQDAFCALGELGGQEAIRRLEEGIQDRTLDMAAFAGLRVLAREHPHEARTLYGAIGNRLGDDRSYMVEEAMNFLQLIPDPALVPMLRAFAERPEIPSYRAGDTAVEILEGIGSEEASRAAALLRQRSARWTAEWQLKAWQERYLNDPPVGPVLRMNHPKIWTRIHYLPLGRRPARNAEDEQTVVERFNAVMGYLGFSVVVVLAVHLDPRDEEIEILQPFGAIRLPMPAEWTTALSEHFDLGSAQLAVAELPWTHGCLDDLWRAAARDRIGRVALYNLPTGDALCPYDGGADIFVWDEGSRAGLRERFRSWLPDESTQTRP